jgi:predicted nuclease of predicted toxin-antitoxin system
MARFLVDESLPTLLAEELAKAGHKAVHAYDVGL